MLNGRSRCSFPLRTVGRRADVTVFSRDLMTAAPDEIPTAAVAMTIVDGVVVHEA